MVPVYSGYIVTCPLLRDVSISSVEPMFSLYCTWKPSAIRACR